MVHADGTPGRSPAEDLRNRLVPDPHAVAAADAAIAAVTERIGDNNAEVLAIVPMALPGKSYGMWRTGQEVHTVPGVIVVGRNIARETNQPPRPPPWLTDYAQARNTATALATGYLRAIAADGTIAYATVTAGGSWAVFEEFAQPTGDDQP